MYRNSCKKKCKCCCNNPKHQTPNRFPYFATLNPVSLEHLLFAVYLVLFSWLVTRTAFIKNTGLSKPQVVSLFLLKVLAGIVYGWIGVYYGEMAQMVDTWGFHYESIKEYGLLKTVPGEFFSSIFHNTYQEGYTKFLASENSWWNDLKGTVFVKLLAIFNLASFGHYYINVIFYSFLTLFGPVALYRVMKDAFPNRQLVVVAAVFLVPSFLYWTSGLHKDGLVFLGIAIAVYSVYFGLKDSHFSAGRILLILFGLLMVLTLRNFLIIPLLPALGTWVLASKIKAKSWLVFTGVYLFFAALFFTAGYIHPRLNFPEEVVSRQQAFLHLLGGNSAVEVSPLHPTLASFVRNTPQALALSAVRPYPSDVRHLLSLAAALEINFLLLLVAFCLFFKKKDTTVSPLLLFYLFFSFSVLLMIGYTVNILGAIVRYRSIVLPLLIVPVVARADWNRIGNLFAGKGK